MKHMFINKLKSININNWLMGHDENYMMLQGDAYSNARSPFITDPRSVILSDIYAQVPPIAHGFVATCFDEKQLNYKCQFTYQCNYQTPTHKASDNLSIECIWTKNTEFHISVQSNQYPDGMELAYFMESYEENNIAYLPVASYFSENKYGGASEYLLTTNVFDSFEQATAWLNAFKAQHPEFKPHAFAVRFFEKSELQSDEWFDMNMHMLKKTNGYSDAWKDAFDLHFDTMYYNMFDNMRVPK